MAASADRFTEAMRALTQRRPTALRSLMEFVGSAPILIIVVLGLPAILLLLATALTVSGLGRFVVARMHLAGAGPFGTSTTLKLIVLGFACLVGSLALYWVLSFLYFTFRRRPSFVVEAPQQPAGGGGVLQIGNRKFTKIGIVLAGGGAKGVYQAGAMEAIHAFLDEKNALGAVQSIAGTSIGSWNALFWIGGLTGAASAPGSVSAMQRWWTTYRLSELVRPAVRTIPGLSAHLVKDEPWQNVFDRLYGGAGAPGHDALLAALGQTGGAVRPKLRFYFSRTNVLPGRLAFDTNDPKAVERTEAPTHDIDLARRVTSIPMVREAVFTSMGIPPLFPYSRITGSDGSTWCEDGGVVDNLPTRLATAFEPCDLLFMLPLNSSFAIEDRPRFLPTRLWRVVDIRQGILERMALKNTYLYNIQHALMNQQPTPAFVVAPGQPLRIATTELWRSSDLRAAVYEQTRAATAELLESFFAPEALDRFFGAYDTKRDRPTSGLDETGFLRMYTIPPGWEPNVSLGEEMRF